MKILALDLGTQLGWAKWEPFMGGVSAGTLELASVKNLQDAKKSRMDRRLDIRIGRLTDWLWNMSGFDWLVFEDVKFASSQAQAHLWASFRGIVWAYAHRTGINIDCLDTSKLKLWTTGNGGAKKEAMACAALRRWPEYTVGRNLDDNACDALCLLMWARETIKV